MSGRHARIPEYVNAGSDKNEKQRLRLRLGGLKRSSIVINIQTAHPGSLSARFSCCCAGHGMVLAMAVQGA